MTDTNRDDELTRALRRLKDADAAMGASAHVEAHLLQEVRGLRTQPRRWRVQVLAGLAAAAMILAAISLTWWSRSRHVPDPNRQGQAVNTAAQEVATEFFPLFYSSVPAARGHLVRLELPRASLARFGLMSADAMERTPGTVLADVLIGDDGLARAVRFVRKLSQEQRQ
jgi:hypothetical protein